MHACLHFYFFNNFFCRWLERVNLKVRAKCGYPPELKGQKVQDIHVFKSCPGQEPPTSQDLKSSKTRKSTKSKPGHVNVAKVIKKTKAKPNSHKNAKSQLVQKTSAKNKKSVWSHNIYKGSSFHNEQDTNIIFFH